MQAKGAGFGSLNWRGELIQYALIFSIGGFFQEYVVEHLIMKSEHIHVLDVLRNGFFWLFLWKGSQYLVLMMDELGIYWIEQPVKRLLISVITTVAYVIAMISLILYIEFVVIRGVLTNSEFISRMSIDWYWTGILITFSIGIFMHGRGFFLEWREALVAAEKFRNESLQARYESLKNQVNPHFLFNSLNALSSLVYDDQAKAVEFIRKLSQVYRYVLEKKDLELVPLEDELAFMQNYIFLQKIRFGDNLRVELDFQEISAHIPPIALQILVENAIKHNVVSEHKPLTISIVVDDSYCTVRNNIQEKLEKDSTGVGLNNLIARYQYLTDRALKIGPENDHFVVKLPLLNIEE